MDWRMVGSQELYDDRRAGNINGRRKQEMNVRIVSSAVLAAMTLLAGVGRGGLPPNQILIRRTPADLSIQRGAQTTSAAWRVPC
jgi:hypothetical protein